MIVGCVWFVATHALAGSATATREEVVSWAIGQQRQRQLNQVVSIHWDSLDVRDALERLSRQFRIALFLDRRVDPSQNVDLRVQSVTLVQLLEQLAATQNLGLTWIGDVGYLGPRGTTDRLATWVELQRQSVRALPPSAAAAWAGRSSLDWAFLSEPRQVVEQMAGRNGITLLESQRVPHDLWRAMRLPPLTPYEQLTLVLAGFDLTVEILPEGRSCRVIPLPANPVLRRAYRLGPVQRDRLAAWLARRSTARVVGEDTSGKIELEGRLEDHQALRGWLTGRRAPSAAAVGGERRYTLRVQQQPAERVLRSLAQQLNMSLQMDPGVHERLRQPITLDVQQVTWDELADQLGQVAGVTIAIEGRSLRVTAP